MPAELLVVSQSGKHVAGSTDRNPVKPVHPMRGLPGEVSESRHLAFG
jgi:hypothetical protein